MRRRSTPWIYRWSRPIMGSIAALGAIETAYLTILKLSGGSAICPTSGCDKVLNSAYASIFGIPLPLLGFLAYVAMGIMALLPLAINPDTHKEQRLNAEKLTWLGLFFGGTAMLVCSGYLMYLLAFELKDLCIYCIASALFSTSLFILALIGHEWENMSQIFFNGIIVAMVTLIGVLGVFSGVAKIPAANSPTEGNAAQALPSSTLASNQAPPITTKSGPAEIELAKHLTKIGAKEYGAYWCPHCHEQKQLFGKEASNLLNYIECDAKGVNGRPDLCQAAGIEGFPSWQINGKLYTGTQSLENLSKISGYPGKRNFINSLPGRK